jgi:hypothetical protein
MTTTIPISRYVAITSGVVGAAAVPERELIGRFFTENPLAPTDTVLEFESAADVGTYFGSTSDEYKRAVFYFGWVSKNDTAPQKISFARWANVDVASTIYGNVATYSVSQFTSVTTGDFTLTLGGFTHHLTGIDTHLAGSLATVATDIQTAIQAFSGGGTAWTSATVTYNSTRKSFDLVSGDVGDDTIAVTAGVVVDMAALLGWETGAIFSNGQDAQTITEVLTASASTSNNFGSFTFIPSLTLDEVTEAAEWNNAQNVQFIYSVAVSAANASAWNAALADIGGVTLTLAPLSTEYPEEAPMMIFAATDYEKRNSVQNYEFQQFNLTQSVSTTANADLYDGLSINYYGQTQNAGQLISFYQRGVMFGLPVDPIDQNLYANEIWLKAAMTSSLMTLLLALSQLSANATGRAQVLTIIQGVINRGLTNGVISVGKTLSDIQKAYITNATGDNLAWHQVQNNGYWIDAEVVPYVESLVTKYKIVYTLIYSKDDVIRKIEGSDQLI